MRLFYAKNGIFFVTHYRTTNYKNVTRFIRVSNLTLSKNLLKRLFLFLKKKLISSLENMFHLHF